jgi:hypothetical protein
MDEKFKFKFSLANLLWMTTVFAVLAGLARMLSPATAGPAIVGVSTVLCGVVGARVGGFDGFVKGVMLGLQVGIAAFVTAVLLCYALMQFGLVDVP